MKVITTQPKADRAFSEDFIHRGYGKILPHEIDVHFKFGAEQLGTDNPDDEHL